MGTSQVLMPDYQHLILTETVIAEAGPQKGGAATRLTACEGAFSIVPMLDPGTDHQGFLKTHVRCLPGLAPRWVPHVNIYFKIK